MDTHFDVDALRARLMEMDWGELVKVSHQAGLSASTVDKIRRGLSKDPGVLKVSALCATLRQRDAAAKRKTRTP